MSNLSITTIILTKNEGIHIKRCIENAKLFSCRILVIDSFSQDETINIARTLGADVFQRKFVSHADQFNWAVDNCSIDTEWIFRLDADEYLEDNLIQELFSTIPITGASTSGFCIRRKHFFLGRWIKHGGRFPIFMLRLFRPGHARSEDRLMDEHIYLLKGHLSTLEGTFVDENLNDIEWFVRKHVVYARKEAEEILRNLGNVPIQSAKLSHWRQRIIRQVKDNLYPRIPLFVRPTMYFIYRYIFRLGILDGKAGFIYHYLQGYWYRVLVDCFVMELKSKNH